MRTPKINIGPLLKEIKLFGDDANRLSIAVTNSTADDIVNNAKQRAPVDLGQLRQSIGKTVAREGYNRSFIFANTPYAAYVEFGTGAAVSIPKGFESIALAFKGKGIKQINIQAQPYLIPAYLIGINQYRKKLKSVLNRLAEKYNAKK
jgi:HK97 gp10 family phage protein